MIKKFTGERRVFIEKCRIIMQEKLKRNFDKSILIPLSTKGHGQGFIGFSFATPEQDIAVACRVVNWTNKGKLKTADYESLNKTVHDLQLIPPSVKLFLVLMKVPHPIENETIAAYYTRLNSILLGRVNVLEISEDCKEVNCLYGSLDKSGSDSDNFPAKQDKKGQKALSLDATKLGEIRRNLFLVLDHVEGDRRRDEGPSKRISRLRTSKVIPPNIANLMQTVVSFRNIAEYESYLPTEKEVSIVITAWEEILDWAKSKGFSHNN